MPLYDMQCLTCGDEHEGLANRVIDAMGKIAPPPKIVVAYCAPCDEELDHERFISAPAQYMGEINHNPRVVGGSFDTAGHQQLPAIPGMKDIPTQQQYSETAQRIVNVQPADAISEVLNRPEVKEVQAERKEIRRRNRNKRQRDAAINRGENINFGRNKTDRLPGDPKHW